jgi:cytochrome c biogenesis protein CcdA
MQKKFLALLVLGVVLFGGIALLKSGNIGASVVWSISDEGKWLLPLVSIAALIDSVNPCAFSILLLTIAFLLSLGKTRLGVLKVGGFYIAGLFTVYILIGLGILEALRLFNTPHFMAKVGATILLLLGAINIINEFFPGFPIKPRIPRAAHAKMAVLMERASLPAAFFLGALVGLCEFPCTGGPYLMILGLLHDQNSYAAGLGYLLLYNLIFVLPLVVILLLASNPALIEKVKAWKSAETKSMRLWSGIAMILLGALMFAF